MTLYIGLKVHFCICIFIVKFNIAGGLHERCTYFRFDVQDDPDVDRLMPLAEQKFYMNSYADLLCPTTQTNHIKHALAQVLCIVKLFGY